MPCSSATLVVWTTAWLHGAAASDDVLDAMQVWAELHEVAAADDDIATRLDLPGPGQPPAALASLLATLRKKQADDGRLILPVPGDVRGLGGNGPLATAAVRAGEAIVLPTAGMGIVPQTVADQVVRWTVFELPWMVWPEHMPIGEAEHELAGAMRQAATRLIDLDVTRQRTGVREEIEAVVTAQPAPPWPTGMPPRSLRVLQRATEVAAILRIASLDAPGAAVSASAIRARAEALRPLSEAVRNARYAAIDEAVRVLSTSRTALSDSGLDSEA
ncbi:MAG: hypothetical protein JOZ47_01260 [Kutzneria sp.]|nr:hypothetical protein [Kutzneria sp.]MBV9843690.1 hypothetical protein [Kutzneria sp.]